MTGVEPGAFAAATRPFRRPPRLITLVALTALAALSMNVFLPSLPGMARDFGVDYAVMQLSVSAYLAAGAVLQFVAGPISDHIGRRPVTLGSIVIFLLATLGTILATTATMFLFFRMIQAVITAGMVLSRAVVRDTAPPDQAASRLGYVTMGMSVVPMMAPAIGGVLDEAFGWRANFVMLGAVGVLVLIWAWHDMGETVADGGTSLREQARGYPVLFGSPSYWGYVGIATFGSGTFFAYLGGAPFVGSSVFGMSPSEVGYWFAAPSFGYLLGNFLSGRFSGRVGINRMIVAGGAVTLAAVLLSLAIDLGGGTVPLSFFGTVVLMGIGNGMVLPNANAGMMSVRPDLAGTAAGLGGALMVAGGAALAALAGALLVPGAGATPLVAIMAVSAAASLASILLVRRG
ncbi:Bcr/CflA family efflux MFS transporter [Paracoccus sp. S-4012]|uniref:multidrug effflux MFS transporter n=1 Tax=Paracoccus sp. S-4012 TaxID=2665648 RepID=UPI0012B09756|nr:multidrug effflux MFS transporter [Paracoccus sp. S-4012]MRX49067.1 Bcr/CflA family efflux MFS transporter [Paracoccus sp. S-4012]